MSVVRRSIPNAVPHLAGNEWKYVKECLDTGWVSSVGKFVDRDRPDYQTLMRAQLHESLGERYVDETEAVCS